MYHFLPVAIRYDGTATVAGQGFQLNVGPMRSKSRGHVKIKSSNPNTAPEIKFNYLSHSDGLPEFRKALRLSREILAQEAMRPFYDHETHPGANAIMDADLHAFIQSQAVPGYHPCGTFRMGAENDALAAVSPDCRVIGTTNLLCADSSLFPRITNGNSKAPSIMVGEKAADHIFENPLLAPTNDGPFKRPEWQSQQR